MTAWLHSLDYWSYQFLAAVWGLYWPTLLIIAAFTLLERWFPLAPSAPWRAVRFNLILQAIALSAFVVLSWTAWGELLNWLNGKAGKPVFYAARADAWWIEVARIFLVLAIADLMVYWVHRWSHKLPILWSVHRLHHDEEHLHAATSIRQHWLSIPVSQLLLLPVAWLWGSDSISPWFSLAVVALAAFHHANLRLPCWRIPPLLVGPQMHRIHHARTRALHDKNFAAVFPFWDMLFGTYVAPAGGHVLATGLEAQATSDEHWRTFYLPLADWLSKTKRLSNHRP